MIKKIGVKQAVKQGYIVMEIPGVFDTAYPTSKLRRGRVQWGGKVSPTITCETGICKIIKYKGDY